MDTAVKNESWMKSSWGYAIYLRLEDTSTET
jgi:hypothetical protein